MTSSEIRQKFLEFFKTKGHKILPSHSLIPDNDPTTLFISAGMQPLIPYLLGETHSEGKKVVGVQKCLRTDDIDEVGDDTHHTFFEMLGNWSFGDYFKDKAISWSFEFLTSTNWLNIPKEKLAISVFAGDKDAPFDNESYQKWLSLGIPKQRIAKLPKKNNWWGPAGQTGPCGPDTEIFYWASPAEPPTSFDANHPNWVEIWNDVFMQYKKNSDGSFELLKQQNVDTGMGLERTAAVFQGIKDNYQSDLFLPIIQKIEEQTSTIYSKNIRNFRIIADHIKAATFLIKDGVVPSNKLQGYVLRRLLRRAAVKINALKPGSMEILPKLVDPVIDIYQETNYFQTGDWDQIRQVVSDEIKKFSLTMKHGLNKLDQYLKHNQIINGLQAFDLYQSDGFPPELTIEIVKHNNSQISDNFLGEFENAKTGHSDLSRTAAAGMFKGGLADHSEETTKLHTATHLLQAALKEILGKEVGQRGSNITHERLRFDFNYSQKLTEEQIKEVEGLVNQKIKAELPVHFDIEERDEAIKNGVTTNFGENYPNKVKVYKIGNFSQELCGGPHVDNTKVLNHFKITKQESLGSNLRRIYATLS